MSINDNTVLARLRQAREPKAKKQPETPRRTAPLKKAIKPIKGRSEKMRGIIAALRPLYDAFLKDKEECAIKSPVCTGRPTVVHHTEGRGITKIMDQQTWMASCPACNGFVEANDSWARDNEIKKSKF